MQDKDGCINAPIMSQTLELYLGYNHIGDHGLSALADAIRPGSTGPMVIRPGDVPGLSMARLGRVVLQEKKAKFGDDQFDVWYATKENFG